LRWPAAALATGLVGYSLAHGAAVPRAPGLRREQLAEKVRGLVAAPALRSARVGVAVLDLVDGEWLFEHDATQLHAVASNNKLATTAAALELLGPGFEFRTTVAAVGRISADGTLRGDLLLVGRGDPSISGRFHKGKTTVVLEQWAEAVAAAGIKAVRGGIIADDTYFDRQHTHPLWPKGQHAAWYSAPVGALSFNDNCVLLSVVPGATRGSLARAFVEPKTSYVQLRSTCRTSRARLGGNRVLAHRRAGTNQILVSGEIRHKGAPFRTWITVDDPALYTATVFREVLEAKGIAVGGPPRLRTPTVHIHPSARLELATTSSLLKDALAVANKNSQNFYAEQLLKTLGREKKGRGTFAAGAEVVAAFLRDAGVRGTFSYRDGSGLARTNRFSPRQLVTLLSYMNGRRWGAIYLRSLAEPGQAGTLARRLLPVKERLHAKTGYIKGVSALSGYVEAHGGRLLAFSILVNDFRCSLGEVRAIQDAICLNLAQYRP
jgi:D-alanyl-D-alanine carboxypeptidase/D-alanyl-D-alanine-endopeptidase (penicillin-binding protein 4)